MLGLSGSGGRCGLGVAVEVIKGGCCGCGCCGEAVVFLLLNDDISFQTHKRGKQESLQSLSDLLNPRWIQGGFLAPIEASDYDVTLLGLWGIGPDSFRPFRRFPSRPFVLEFIALHTHEWRVLGTSYVYCTF